VSARRFWDVGAAAALCSIGFASSGCMPEGLLVTPVTARQNLVEEVLRRETWWGGDKIALFNVDGVLLNMHEPRLIGEGEHPVSLLLEQLDRARRDPQVKAAVLRINSPGGSVTAAEMMYNEVVRFRRSGRPVVAVLTDVGASGGYYIACACDEIWAHKSTVTGSIGVIMQLLDLSGTMQKIGLAAPAITSGPNKDAGSPFKPMTPEQQEIFQSIVDGMYKQFIDVVKEGRPNLTEQRVRELADGRVYGAQQALENGLIDRIGTMQDAIDAAKQRVGAKAIRLVTYRRPLGYKPNYYAQAYPAPSAGGDVNLINLDLAGMLRGTTPQFLYLWAPGCSP
jgi:protease-4